MDQVSLRWGDGFFFNQSVPERITPAVRVNANPANRRRFPRHSQQIPTSLLRLFRIVSRYDGVKATRTSAHLGPRKWAPPSSGDRSRIPTPSAATIQSGYVSAAVPAPLVIQGIAVRAQPARTGA